MTKTEVIRLIRKLHRRRRMIDEVTELESRLSAYLASRNCSEVSIPGLKAAIVGDEIVITETPLIDERQLNLLEDYFCLKYEKGRV